MPMERSLMAEAKREGDMGVVSADMVMVMVEECYRSRPFCCCCL